MKNKRCCVRVSGFGGQGVVLSGFMIGKAAAIFDGKHAAFTQNYGPEARGGACCGMIVINDHKIGYPMVTDAHFFIAMSKEGYDKYIDSITPDARVFVDSDLVEDAPLDDEKTLRIPATRLAHDMGKTIVANVIMLGFFTRHSNAVSKEAMIESIRTSVKTAFVDLNLEAFEIGYGYADKL